MRDDFYFSAAPQHGSMLDAGANAEDGARLAILHRFSRLLQEDKMIGFPFHFYIHEIRLLDAR